MNRFLRHLKLRPALTLGLAVAVLVAVALGLTRAVPPSTAVILGWNAGILAYLASILPRMASANADTIRRRSRELDEGRWTIFAMTIGAAVASVVAIFVDLVAARGAPGTGLRAGLAAATILASWTFVHVVFAHHYAHLWFRDDGGLDFPGEDTPDYFDFLYFSFVVGMTFQVSDVQTKTSTMRGLVLVHGIVSFLFNTGILALSVNLAAGLA